jgi:CRP-like cAMP-binding protein
MYNMFSNLETALQQYMRLSADDLATLQTKLQIQTVNKHETILKKGQVCRAVYFVNKGACKQVDDEETIINLFATNEWMLDFKSFTTQQPAVFSLIAAEDSELFCLTVHDLHELIQSAPVFFQLGKLMEAGHANLSYQNHRLTPEEKYELLLKEKPQYIQLFPAKVIASFLGIAPETLSRVRRKIIS